MRMRHRRRYVEQQPHACCDVEAVPIAVAVDRFTVDMLEHQVRLAARRQAGVEKLRDVPMADAGEDLALPPKPGLTLTADEAGIEQLDRDHALETSVGAVGEPYGA